MAKKEPESVTESNPFERPEDKDFPYEVQVVRDNGQEVWLVPQRTGKYDLEITPGDLRMMWALTQVAFPGSHVEEIRKVEERDIVYV